MPLVKKYSLWIVLSILWIFLVQGAFYAVQKSQAQNLTRSIHGQLRQDLAISNFHFLSRNLMDLESSKTMKCIRLTLKADKNIDILNTFYRGRCEENDLLLQGAQVNTELKAVNGDLFELEFISLNSSSFYLALWFIRIIGILQILSFSLYQKIKTEKDRAIFDLEQRHSQKLIEIASQVAHDIRSPLSALSMVIGTLKDIPEEKKTLVLHATQRINDIANNLLQKNSLQPGSEKPTAIDQNFNNNSALDLNLSTVYIPQIIELLISEKRLQFQNYSDTLITSDFSESFGSFAKIDGVEFARTLSNLINNSVESLVDQNGKVLVAVHYKMRGNSKLINIVIQDNGRGIPKEILKRLGEKGVSFGKNGTQSGSGLGVYHAKKTIESFDGEFSIDSTEGKGTTVSILLPLAEAPDWFAQKINLAGKKYLVTLDDDSSIHQIWIERLSSVAGLNIEHIKFQSGESFEKYVNNNINKIKECIFLVDYELSNQAKTGLQIIEDLVIEKHSILVTSRYEDQDVLEKAKKLNLKILPKNLCGFVPLNLV